MKTLLVGLIFLLPSTAALADEDLLDSGSQQAPFPPLMPITRVSLLEILDTVRLKSGKTFLIDMRVRAEVVIGQIDASNVTYPMLLTGRCTS